MNGLLAAKLQIKQANRRIKDERPFDQQYKVKKWQSKLTQFTKYIFHRIKSTPFQTVKSAESADS